MDSQIDTKSMNGNIQRWKKAIIVTLLVFFMLSFYLFLRRGYFNLYIANKVFASTAVILVGITLVIGPLRRIPLFASFMIIRRQLGLLAFGLVIFHVAASLYQTNRFSLPSWYIKEILPITFGLLAVFIWGYMAYISRNTKIQQMGALWMKYLSIGGRLAFLAIFLHLTVMKYEGWIKWWNGQVQKTPELANPSYPPASLFVFLFMSIVILYRVFVFFKRNRS